MNTKTSLEKDLQFIAGAVRRGQRKPGHPVIYFLWAALILIGWTLPDFAPQYAAMFWIIAGPAGGLLSWWLGQRSAIAEGELDRDLARRYGLHWLISGMALFAVFLPLASGNAADGYSSAIFGRQFLLVIALVYALAAVHLERGLAASAVIMGAGYVVLTIWSPPYLWTTMGIVVALSLLVAGLWARR